jgi:death-on-curing protein
MTIEYLTITEVLALHRILIDSYGGAHGVRDQGALESALMRPQLGYYATLLDQAAALLESLANNHPFIDGNKRVAVAVTDTFLRINGFRIVCRQRETYDYLMKLFATNSFRFEQLRTWLELVVVKLP